MKNIPIFLACVPFLVTAQSDSLSTAHFSLDACAANFGALEQFDYSEFTAEIDNSGACSDLEIIGGILYRDNPEDNMHSCSFGVDGDPAMCISTHHDCSFTTGDHALKIDVRVTPGDDGVGILSGLRFYEKAPPEYVWINGGMGPNAYPQYFAVIVLKDDVEIYRKTGNVTQMEWNLREFDFSSRPEFMVTEPTVFNIELYSYCPVHNGADVSAWDVDEITVLSDCCVLADGGTLSGGPFEFCVGDGEADFATGVAISGNVGSQSRFVITDTDGTILALPGDLDAFDFEEGDPGNYQIWNVSYYGALGGLEVGGNIQTGLQGDCFGLSEPITVVRNQQPEGGALIGGPFEFCVGDGEADVVSGIILGGNTGATSRYVVTDTANTILALPAAPDSVNFDELGPGIVFIWHLSYDVGPTGLEVGNDLMDDVDGCFGLSNPIMVTLNELPTAGELSGGPFEFCVGDGTPDHATGVLLSGGTGEDSQYIITDEENNILALPDSPEEADFDGGGPGICLIWHITYNGDITGLEQGNNLLEDVEGCFALSNAITVVRNQPDGGELTGGPFEFCVGDSLADVVSGVELIGAVGTGSQYIVTDTNNTILALPPHPDSVNFDGAGPGICLIWHLSYFDTIGGLVQDSSLADLTGCFDLSNAVEVIRNEQPDGGELAGGPFEFCVDTIQDFVSGVELMGNTGSGSQYVITDTLGTILGLPPAPDSVDFNEAGPGVCLIWHLAFEGAISGLEVDSNVSGLMGCFNFSDSITVTRLEEPCSDSLRTGDGVYEFSAYPNPGNDWITLDFENYMDEEVTIEMIDLYGRMCLSETCERNGYRTLDVRDLPEGQYYIKVSGSKGSMAKVVVLMR